uniref:histidine kinase n=1 Tax=Amphora coffeiformis TaxID=265554 RepID=A0A7S3KWF8_9STRA
MATIASKTARLTSKEEEEKEEEWKTVSNSGKESTVVAPPATSHDTSSRLTRKEQQQLLRNDGSSASPTAAASFMANSVVDMAELFHDFMTFGSVGLHIVDHTGIILWANQAELDLLGYTADEYFGSHISQYHADADILNQVLTTLLRGGQVENVVAPLKHKNGTTIEYVQINSSMRQDPHTGLRTTTRCFSARVTDKVLRVQELAAAAAQERLTAAAAQETARKAQFLRSLCHELRNPLGGVTGNLELLVHKLNMAQQMIQSAASADPTSNESSWLPQLQQTITAASQYATNAQLAAEHQLLVINDTLSLSKLEATTTRTTKTVAPPEQNHNDTNTARLQSPQTVRLGQVLDTVQAIFSTQAKEKEIALSISQDTNMDLFRTDPVWLKQILLNLVGNALKFTHQGGCIDVRATLEDEEPNDTDTTTKLRLEVQDTGIGMTPDEQSKLFGAFCQANERISAQFGGSGLGLHIVQEFLTRVGGTISIQSQKGVGSTFEIQLPVERVVFADDDVPRDIDRKGGPVLGASIVTRSTTAPLEGERSSSSSSSKQVLRQSSLPCLPVPLPPSTVTQDRNQGLDKTQIKVLVVDDSHMNRNMMAAFLRRSGYLNYKVAKHGQQALEMHATDRFDIILSDVDMPVQGGYEMTRRLRSQESQEGCPRPTIVFGISGNTLPCDFELGRKAGMDEYVEKPYKFSEIEALMLQHLKMRSS